MNSQHESASLEEDRSWFRLRRVMTGGKYVPEIDGVRFVAIFLVLIQHLHERLLRRVGEHYPKVAGSALDDYLISGGVGVSIFFALSGYILHRNLSRQCERTGSLQLKKYFLRRLTRLEPPYVVVTTLIFLVLLLGLYQPEGKYLGSGERSLWISYLTTITYTHTVIFNCPPAVNPPGWTLEAEVQFYLIAPIVTLLLWRLPSRRLRVALLLIVTAAWPLLIGIHLPEFRFLLGRKLPYFLVGLIVYELREQYRASSIPGALSDVLILFSMAALILPRGLEPPAKEIWQCIWICVFLYCVLTGGMIRRILSLAPLALIGGMCYTIYLIHVPAETLVIKVTSGIGLGYDYSWYLLIQAVLVLLPVLVVSTVFFLLIERPCMRSDWPKQLYFRFCNPVTPAE